MVVEYQVRVPVLVSKVYCIDYTILEIHVHYLLTNSKYISGQTGAIRHGISKALLPLSDVYSEMITKGTALGGGGGGRGFRVFLTLVIGCFREVADTRPQNSRKEETWPEKG